MGERRDRAAEDRPETGTGTAPSDGDAGQAENRDESGPSDTPIQGDRHGALVDGERALRAGDYRLALALAERALRHGGGVAAHALRAAASCGIGDLGNAKASFLRIPRRNQTVRRRVLGFCATSGVELGP